jgi:hypothetical protein
LTEIGVAMLLFMLVAGSVTATATRSIMRDADAQLTRAATAALTTVLAQVEAGGYQNAMKGVRADGLPLCENSSDLCVDVGPYPQVPVSLQVGVIRTTQGGATVTSAEVTASVTVPGGSEVARSVTVLAPADGFDTGERGVFRVTFDGPAPATVAVLDRATDVSVGTASVTDGLAIVKVDPQRCTATQPCRLALSSQAPYFEERGASSGVGLRIETARRSLVATPGRVVDVSAGTVAIGAISSSATIALAADRNGRQSPREPGSVCLWLQLDSGPAPVCNTEDATKIDALRVPFDPSAPQLLAPVPAGTPWPVSVDRGDGSCPEVAGQRGHRASGWSPQAVCTSWTWGHPATWEVSGQTTMSFSSATLQLPAGTSSITATAVWSGDSARPAVGFGSDPLWAKPREALPCTHDATCDPVKLGSPPEALLCPGKHCLSVASLAPQFTGPRRGQFQVLGGELSGANIFAFPLAFVDGDDDEVTLKVVESPTSGTLRLDNGAGPVLSAGSELGTFEGSGTVNLHFTGTSGNQLVRFAVELSDGSQTVREALAINRGAYTWTVKVDQDRVLAAQGTSQPLSFTAVGADGAPRPGGLVNVAVVAQATPTQPLDSFQVTADSSGQGTLSLDLTSAPSAGEYLIRFTPADSPINGSGAPAVSVPLTVLAAPASLDLTAVTVAQGATGNATVSATDLSGAPMADVVVRLAFASGTPLPADAGLHLDRFRCVTGTSGTCTFDVSADTAVLSGSYRLEATSGSFSANADVTVLPVVTSFDARPLVVAQGFDGPLVITVRDGAGTGIAGVNVNASLAQATPGITVQSGSFTNSNGQVDLLVTASSQATTGPAGVQLSAAGVGATARILVAGRPASIAFDRSNVSLTRAGSTQLVVTVRDAAGTLLPRIELRSEVDGPFLADARRFTGTEGTASFTLEGLREIGLGQLRLQACPTYTTSANCSEGIDGSIPVTVTAGGN